MENNGGGDAWRVESEGTRMEESVVRIKVEYVEVQ